MRNLSSAQPKYEHEDFPEEDFSEEEIDKEPEEEKPKPELVKSKEDIEQEMEKQEIKINTVDDFINDLEWRHNECEDEQMKNKIALQVTKIETALRVAGLSADKVYVSKMPDGVLGLFYPNANRVEFSEDLLSDFNSDEQLIKTVFVHEEVHKDKKFADEGLTQLFVKKKISATPGIYEEEQRAAKRAFYKVGIDRALKLYDIDHPGRLFGECLKIGLEYKYRGQTKMLEGIESNKRRLEFLSSKEKERISREFKKGAEELFKKLIPHNYNIKKEIKKILQELAEK